jgi:membrane fusion protein (multidrug efflux system)
MTSRSARRRRSRPGRPRRNALSLAAPLLAALALFPATGCGSAGGSDEGAAGPEEVPINVRVVDLEKDRLDEYVSVTGPLRPRRGTDISTEESGTVERIVREKGSAVRAGDPVLVLDRALLETEMRSTAANVELLEYDESRSRKLFEEKAISRWEMLSKETALAQARAAADAARTRWERAAIKAPFDGLVADRYAEPGQLVAPGSRVARIVDPYTLKLVAAVSEREVAWIHEGAGAAVELAGNGGTVSGRVAWVSFEADPGSGKFQVEVWIDNPDLTVRPGIVARARILKRSHEDVIVVPRDAVVPQKDGDAVFIVEDSRARMRPVALGPDQGLLAVVERGLGAGDRLIVRGQREVLDGSLVRVTERATSVDGSIESDPPEVRAPGSPATVEAVKPSEVPPAPAPAAPAESGTMAGDGTP